MNPLPLFTEKLRPEARLLLYCARARLDGCSAEEMRPLLSAGMDWGSLVSLVLRHNMFPRLYRNLEALCWEGVPPSVQKDLRDQNSALTRYSLILTAELLRLLNLFEAKRIPSVPFRGPTLATLVYGDPLQRQFGDLDILVYKHDVVRVKDLLSSCGYRPLFPLPSEDKALFNRYAYPFVSSDKRIFVDLHWDMQRAYFAGVVEPDPLWGRLERLFLEGQPILTLSRPDLILHLCMHGTKHQWKRLDWICDLAELIRAGNEMDWHWIMAQSHASGSKRMTCLGIFLASVLLGVDIPEEVRPVVQTEHKMKPLAEQVYKRLFQTGHADNLLFEEIAFYLRTMDRLRDRIGYCMDRVTHPTAWSVGSLSLPSSLKFLHFFHRPLQLLKQYGFKQGYSESLPK